MELGRVGNVLKAARREVVEDVNVVAFPGRYLVEFTGQFSGEEDWELRVASHALTGQFTRIAVSQALQWIDANRIETIHGHLPMEIPTPLIAGTVVTAGWIPEAARYCVLNAECRDLDFTDNSY